MSDILIVGGGIIGMMTARELVLAGMNVTIVDQSEAGQESSWAGGGIISPLYPWRYPEAVSALAKWGQEFYPEIIEDLLSETGLDPELVQNGLLTVADEQDNAIEWAKNWYPSLQLIDNKEVYELEPALSPELVDDKPAIWMPGIRQVRNPRLVKTLKQYLLNKNVRILEHTEVNDFLTESGRITGVATSEGNFMADKVLVAGGAWSAKLLKNIEIKVKPVKGQMILFKTKPGTVKCISLNRDRYVIPRKDGRVLVGSTVEDSGFDKSTSTEAFEELRSEAYRLIPCLQKSDIEHHWAGLRPGSLDGIPYICPVPGIEGVFLNAGHFRNGVVLAPASARLAADLILNRTPTLNTAPYQLDQG